MKYEGTETLGTGEEAREIILYSDGYFKYRCYLGYDKDAEPVFMAVDRSPFHQHQFRPAPVEDVCRVYRHYLTEGNNVHSWYYKSVGSVQS